MSSCIMVRENGMEAPVKEANIVLEWIDRLYFGFMVNTQKAFDSVLEQGETEVDDFQVKESVLVLLDARKSNAIKAMSSGIAGAD